MTIMGRGRRDEDGLLEIGKSPHYRNSNKEKDVGCYKKITRGKCGEKECKE